LDVGEGEGQPAPAWTDAEAEQVRDGDGAAHLVAVGERIDHHVRTRYAAVVRVQPGDAAVAGGVGAQVREGDFDRIRGQRGGVHGHAPATAAAMARPMSVVDALPPRSAVRGPSRSTCWMAARMASWAWRPGPPSASRKSSIIAPDQIMPIGLAMFLP